MTKRLGYGIIIVEVVRMKYNPHTYQQEGINKIKAQKALALWWACGLGKSVTTLTAVQELKDSGEVQHVLIIAPKRVAEATWQDEAARWEHYSTCDSVP